MSRISPRTRQAIDFLFPEADRATVRGLLRQYRYHEAVRIHRAILVLSGGDVSRVAHYVQEANLDYRDVLYWAEYGGMPGARLFRRRYAQLHTLNQANP